MLRSWLASHGLALVVGFGLTLLTIGLHLFGITEPIEYQAYDTYTRHCSHLPASDRIVHIGIDDDAGERIGRWPWPRDIQAELIRILHELGAEQTVMDITWNKPQPKRMRLPDMDRYADIEGTIKQIGELSAANLVYPDLELAQAIEEAGNVYLAMYYEEPSVFADKTPTIELAEQIADLLRKNFGLSKEELAEQLTDAKVNAIEEILAGIKRHVAIERVTDVLSKAPNASVQDVHAAILTTPFPRQTADRADIVAAYHRVKSLRNLRNKLPQVPEGLRGKLPVKPNVLPPIYPLIPGAKSVGFVNFGADRVLRDIPLLAEWDGLLLEQLAFTAIRDALDIQLEDLSIDNAGYLVIAGAHDRAPMRIQLDARAGLLLNWHAQAGRWEKCFRHIPVTQIMRIYDARKAIKENEPQKQLAIARAIRLANGEETYARYCRDYNQMLAHERHVHMGKLQGRSNADDVKQAQSEAARLRTLIEAEQEATFEIIKEIWSELETEPNPNDPQIAEDYKRFKAAHTLITNTLPELEQTNQAIATETQRLIDQLKPMIQNKVCFVGYTATAVADMVTTPAFGRAPGVMIHSNLFNSFLQRQFLTWSGPSIQTAHIAMFGIFVTLLTITRGPKITFLVVMATILITLTLNAFVVFGQFNHWLRVIPSLMLTFVAWAVIVLVRYLVTDRQRRRFGKAVAQYVSPAIAKRLSDSAEHVDLSPVSGDVTCFFSDLAGFTTISEALGPEGTKTLLNPYLEAMSNVLHRHEALINKFMGDGIFAFFNPPILPCPQHAQAACDAALESQQALRELMTDFDHHPLADHFKRLFMRIGIASGPVFVGDYGSENKLDYTCMGDVVNLAARLESANKQFGSAVMISGVTQTMAGNRYLYRPLGSLQVKGQTVGVPVYELLGRPGEVDSEIVAQAQIFANGVELFTRRDWSQATSLFEQWLERHPQDPGGMLYLRTACQYQESPPPDEWTGTLELTAK